jgi:hypothetical protein
MCPGSLSDARLGRNPSGRIVANLSRCRSVDGWKWPAVQFAYTTMLAYVRALITNEVVRSGVLTMLASRWPGRPMA